jgi:hypothetical protein
MAIRRLKAVKNQAEKTEGPIVPGPLVKNLVLLKPTTPGKHHCPV